MGRRKLKMRVIAFSGTHRRAGSDESGQRRVLEEGGPGRAFRRRLQIVNSRSRVAQQALETGEVERRGTLQRRGPRRVPGNPLGQFG